MKEFGISFSFLEPFDTRFFASKALPLTDISGSAGFGGQIPEA